MGWMKQEMESQEKLKLEWDRINRATARRRRLWIAEGCFLLAFAVGLALL